MPASTSRALSLAVRSAIRPATKPKTRRPSTATVISAGGPSSSAVRNRERPVIAPSVVVAGVDVDAGHALVVEHLHVAAVVLEGELEVEADAAQLLHGA